MLEIETWHRHKILLWIITRSGQAESIKLSLLPLQINKKTKGQWRIIIPDLPVVASMKCMWKTLGIRRDSLQPEMVG